MSQDTCRELVCWKCGAPLAELPLPLSRLAECPACRAYLHACRLCEFYDPRLIDKCREPRAEEVRDREHANFCDWFRPRPNAYRPPDDSKIRAAKATLDTLFRDGAAGTGDAPAGTPRNKLDQLFGSNDEPKK